MCVCMCCFIVSLKKKESHCKSILQIMRQNLQSSSLSNLNDNIDIRSETYLYRHEREMWWTKRRRKKTKRIWGENSIFDNRKIITLISRQSFQNQRFGYSVGAEINGAIAFVPIVASNELVPNIRSNLYLSGNHFDSYHLKSMKWKRNQMPMHVHNHNQYRKIWLKIHRITVESHKSSWK